MFCSPVGGPTKHFKPYHAASETPEEARRCGLFSYLEPKPGTLMQLTEQQAEFVELLEAASSRVDQFVMIMLLKLVINTIWQWHLQASACSTIKKIDHFLFHISPFIMRRRQIFHYKWGFPISLRPSIFAALHLKTNQR